MKDDRVIFIQGDICDKKIVSEIFENYDLNECLENVIKYIRKERNQGLTLQEKYSILLRKVR